MVWCGGQRRDATLTTKCNQDFKMKTQRHRRRITLCFCIRFIIGMSERRRRRRLQMGVFNAMCGEERKKNLWQMQCEKLW